MKLSENLRHVPILYVYRVTGAIIKQLFNYSSVWPIILESQLVWIVPELGPKNIIRMWFRHRGMFHFSAKTPPKGKGRPRSRDGGSLGAQGLLGELVEIQYSEMNISPVRYHRLWSVFFDRPLWNMCILYPWFPSLWWSDGKFVVVHVKR